MFTEQFRPERRDAPQSEKLHTTETPYTLDGAIRSLRTYMLAETPQVREVPEANTGDWRDVIRRYRNRPDFKLFSETYGGAYADIPYAPLLAIGDKRFGDYSTPDGQNEFKDNELALTREEFSPPPWAHDLWRFARLKQAKMFSHDDSHACLRALDVVNGKLRFTVGSGFYSDAFYSMGSEGVRIVLDNDTSSDELKELHDMLSAKYGAVTLRDAVLQETGGSLTSFGDHVYNPTVGVAGTVLTSDNELVFVRRGGSVGVNRGINVTASGGVGFDADAMSRYGLGEFLGNEMSREAHEELGLKAGTLIMGAMREKIRLELGLEDDSRYDLVPVGFARELPRGGSPEMMFLIRYKGSTEDMVRTIMWNDHEEKSEIDQLVYAMPLLNAQEIVTHPDGTGIVHHKACLNLLLINEYLKNNA